MNKFLTLTVGFLLTFSMANAASILQSKNGKVLISLDGETVAVGQNIGFKNADGKTVAIASVTTVKGSRAIAEVKKGQLSGGETVFFSGGSKPKPAPAEGSEESFTADAEPTSKREVYRLSSTRVAGVLTMGLNNMVTKQADASATPNTEDVTLKGNAIGFTGTLDIPLNWWFSMRGTLGYEPFMAEGDARFLSCDNQTSTKCNANINYISGGGYARINFNNSPFQIWTALGATTKFPLSKTSTALKTDDIKATFTFAGAFGADWFITNKFFIPASVEYQMFQNSDTVSANIIQARIGFGMAL